MRKRIRKARLRVRIFDGRKYTLSDVYTSKTDAQGDAEYWRKAAMAGPFGARVIKHKGLEGIEYELWVSEKKIRKR